MAHGRSLLYFCAQRPTALSSSDVNLTVHPIRKICWPTKRAQLPYSPTSHHSTRHGYKTTTSMGATTFPARLGPAAFSLFFPAFATIIAVGAGPPERAIHLSTPPKHYGRQTLWWHKRQAEQPMPILAILLAAVSRRHSSTFVLCSSSFARQRRGRVRTRTFFRAKIVKCPRDLKHVTSSALLEN